MARCDPERQRALAKRGLRRQQDAAPRRSAVAERGIEDADPFERNEVSPVGPPIDVREIVIGRARVEGACNIVAIQIGVAPDLVRLDRPPAREASVGVELFISHTSLVGTGRAQLESAIRGRSGDKVCHMDTTTGTSERVAGSIRRSPLFRGVIRLALLGLAIGSMWFAEDRYMAFARESAQTFSFDNGLWLTYGAALLLSGLAFGLAVWMPFGKVRFMPSRLAFAAIALIPF